ncbi:HNH endonuclease [Thiogranum longum]|uniref:Putative HNH nuclease YajD n=1 Tax=Thiogranum longum TaxID=1537524 RepID=A0A4R1HC08_9GAMM|nr:YajD family HNH nuclease [Thiogranum longum]TCK19544.1 HNH endonuclease [Thiogranum longum]
MSKSKMDELVAATHKSRDARELGYREQALKLYPWICGRCEREFGRENLHELTVHHRDHNHDYNPSDGSNWELLCLYCHDNEHQRLLEAEQQGTGKSTHAAGTGSSPGSTHKPFAGLESLLKK